MARSCAVDSRLEGVAMREGPRGCLPRGMGGGRGSLGSAFRSLSRGGRRASGRAGSNRAVSSGQLYTEIMELMKATQADLASSRADESAAASPGVVEVPDAQQPGHRPAAPTAEPQLVWGPGKTPQQIAALLLERAEQQGTALATRIEPAMYAAVRKLVPGVEYHGGAKILTLRLAKGAPHRLPGSVAIVTSGTADHAVAEECCLVAEHMGCYAYKITDLGVQDLQKLMESAEGLRAASVVVVVAGVDAALPGVVAGLVDVPVVVVPTSAGYGASMGGVVSLLANLNTACPGISVVNVDDGAGAAISTARVLRTADKIIGQKSKQVAATAANGIGGDSMDGNGAAVEGVALGSGEAGVNGGSSDGINEKAGSKIGKPLLGLLIFQTVPLLPKLVPLGIGATTFLT
eukprot:evm.model.scf_1088.3 EVM.evm.TU.scf_1088.3   scf_1088:32318-38724(+)